MLIDDNAVIGPLEQLDIQLPLQPADCGAEGGRRNIQRFCRVGDLSRIGNGKYTIQRSKGLGENDPDMMSKTTMNPATRRLIAVTPTDASATDDMFELMLGDNVARRRQYIADNGSKYIVMADI